MRSNKQTREKEYLYDREAAVSRRYSNGLPMDPLSLATTMNGLDEQEIQDCLEDYYSENENQIF
ncbi:MAG: hypothetical protein WCT44_02395 [Candidatus Paceibacterota bacterium]